MTARGIIAGMILMTVIANGGIATTEIELRNDNILTIELKKCVRQQLPELGDAKVVALANHLVDSLGVREMDDLIHVEKSDLTGHLKPIQIRKLLVGMKACGSDEKRDANKNKTPNEAPPSTEEDSKDSSSGTSSKILKGVGIGAAAVVGGAGLVAAAPIVLAGIGFTSAGVAAGSWAACAASVAGNAAAGGVLSIKILTRRCKGRMCGRHNVCGYIHTRLSVPIAGLQSAGAAGIGAATTTVLAATGAGVAGGTAYKVLKDGDNE